jgi:hypothetical protein
MTPSLMMRKRTTPSVMLSVRCSVSSTSRAAAWNCSRWYSESLLWRISYAVWRTPQSCSLTISPPATIVRLTPSSTFWRCSSGAALSSMSTRS